jgi:hypothetical protein
MRKRKNRYAVAGDIFGLPDTGVSPEPPEAEFSPSGAVDAAVTPEPGSNDFAQQPAGFIAQPGPSGGYLLDPDLHAGRRRHRRGNWLWALAIILVAAVAAAPVIVAVVYTTNSVNALARVPLPEGGLVTLTHAGGNVIYYEDNGSGSSGGAGFVPGFDLTITPVSAGADVADLTAGGNSSYSFGSHNGTEVFTVQVTHPGQFRVSVTDPVGSLAGADLAIGPGVPVGLFIVGVAATILLAICGVGLLVVLIFRKSARATGTRPFADLLAGLHQMRSEMKRDQ